MVILQKVLTFYSNQFEYFYVIILMVQTKLFSVSAKLFFLCVLLKIISKEFNLRCNCQHVQRQKLKTCDER